MQQPSIEALWCDSGSSSRQYFGRVNPLPCARRTRDHVALLDEEQSVGP